MPVSLSRIAMDCDKDLDEYFGEAQIAAKQSDLGKEDLLRLYAHYKQATVGHVASQRPGMFDPVGRSKWDAWNDLGSMSEPDAKREYCALVERFSPNLRLVGKKQDPEPSGPRPSNEVTSPVDPAPLEQVRYVQVDPDTLFSEAQVAAKTRPDLGNADQLRLYSHYKQATIGSATGSRPGMFDPVKRTKWDAWKALGSMSEAEAKHEYCAIVDDFVPNWRPAPIEVQQAPALSTRTVDSLHSPVDPAPSEQAARSSPVLSSDDIMFAEAQTAAKTRLRNASDGKEDLGNESLLPLYAHYKQATVGPVTGKKPGMFDPVRRAKWKAWNALGSMSQAEAKRKYCVLVDSFVPSWRSQDGGVTPTRQLSRMSNASNISGLVEDGLAFNLITVAGWDGNGGDDGFVTTPGQFLPAAHSIADKFLLLCILDSDIHPLYASALGNLESLKAHLVEALLAAFRGDPVEPSSFEAHQGLSDDCKECLRHKLMAAVKEYCATTVGIACSAEAMSNHILKVSGTLSTRLLKARGVPLTLLPKAAGESDSGE